MVSTGLSRSITQPVTSLTILALMALACQSPIQAKVPSSKPTSASVSKQAPTTAQIQTAPTQVPPTTAPIQTVPGQIPPTTAPGQFPGTAPTQIPPTAPPGQTLPQSEAAVDYVLGGGDRIRINVFEVPEYSGDYQVPPDGDLYLPLIGGVTVEGLTQSEAAETIASRYARFLKRPLITVSLISPRPINITIAGEVISPGAYTVGLQGGAGDNPGLQYPTVVAALIQAQGTTLAADLSRVQLRRREGANRGDRVYNVDLTELVNRGNLSNLDLTLRDGDTVFVPTANRVNLVEIRKFATASFAIAQNRPRSVTVVGEVNRPGSYVVIGGSAAAAAPASVQGATTIQAGGEAGGGLPTVSRAIQLAGGITSLADVRNIQLRRQTKSGQEQTISLNFWQLLRGDANQDTLVQEGDTIIIPTATDINPAEATQLADASFSPANIQISVVGEVRNPGLVNVPPNTPLNQAILTAGGFNEARARKRTVDLIRLNPNGTVTKRKLPVELAAGINSKNNPSLRDNDVVVVYRSVPAKIGDTLGTFLGPVGSVLGIFNLLFGF